MSNGIQPPTVQLKNPALAALLAWLVPGLGHLYQGRIGKGILFFVTIVGLFLFGWAEGNRQVVYFQWDKKEWRYHYIAQLGVGLLALPALVPNGPFRVRLPPFLRELERNGDEEEKDALHRAYGWRIDVAVIYTVVAGLLNMLVIYDAAAGPALAEEEAEEIAGRAARPAGGAE